MPKEKSPSAVGLASLLFVIGRFMRNETKQGGDGKRLSMLHFEALRFVRNHERPSMRELAGYFHITPPAATLLVDGLVKEKMLSRVLDAKDRRSVRVTLTPLGKRVLAHGIQEKMKKLQKVFFVLSPHERRLLIDLLGKMAKSAR